MSVYKPLPKEIFEHYEIYFFDIEKASDVRNLISRMWEENQQLKEQLLKTLENSNKTIKELAEQLDLYKSVLNEVREYEESSSFEVDTRDYGRVTVCDADELALILDKEGDK